MVVTIYWFEMNQIFDEIKQHDTEFIKIPNDKKIIEFEKLYVLYYKIDDDNGKNYIAIESGVQLNIKANSQIEIYEMGNEQSITCIYNIFYNFCTN